VARTLDPISGKFEHVGEDTPRVYGSDQGLLVEAAGRTNEVPYSADIDPSDTVWRRSFNNASTDVTSILGSNQNALKFENTSGNSFRQANIFYGNFTGNTETLSVIYEVVSQNKFAHSIYNNSVGDHVHLVEYDIVNDNLETLQGSGSKNIRKITESGPNGGTVYQLIVKGSSTSGDSRKTFVYPTGTDPNTNAGIVHHVQHEEAPNASSPIVTGSSAKTRAGDDYTIFSGGQPDWWNPNEGTIFGAVLFPAYKQPDFTRHLEIVGLAVLQTKQGKISFNHGDIGFATLARSYTPFTNIKFAVTLEEDSMVFSTNGSSQSNVGLDSVGASTMVITEGVSRWQKLIYYPRALPESTLNTLTT